MTTSHPEIEESIAAYALDAMSTEERAATMPDLLDHLAGCDPCRSTYRDFRETAGDLALGAPPIAVSAEFTDRVMAAVRGREQAPVARPARARRLVRVLMAASLAAVAALGAVSFNAVSDLRTERDRLRRSEAALAVLADPSADRMLLAASGATGSVAMAVSHDGHAVLIGSGLPSVPAGHVFELWLMRDGRPVPAGVFQAHGGAALLLLDHDPRGFDAAAITVEPGPHGTAAPTSDVIFSASLRA